MTRRGFALVWLGVMMTSVTGCMLDAETEQPAPTSIGDVSGELGSGSGSGSGSSTPPAPPADTCEAPPTTPPPPRRPSPRTSGCTPARAAAITARWNAACDAVNDPTYQQCVGNSGLIDMYKRRCAWGNVRFDCGDDLLCASSDAVAHAVGSFCVGRGVIQICEDYWTYDDDTEWQTQTILHEMLHVFGRPIHNALFEKVEDCYEEPSPTPSPSANPSPSASPR